MKLQVLIDMPEDEFKDAVMQAFKRRKDFPEWWGVVLTPELIDATEQVLRDVLEVVDGQAERPARYPQAASFALTLRRQALTELALARATHDEE